MKKNLGLILFILMIPCLIQSQTLNIIPQPSGVEVKQGNFTITTDTKIILSSPGADKSAAFLNDYLKKFYGFELKTAKKKSGNAVDLSLTHVSNSSISGAYNMNVNSDNISINGNDEEGVFYGVQTLIQLLPAEKSNSLTVQQCTIADAPRFAYRGMMLDCGRHFFPVEFVKQYIDFLALHKLNTFHWHLTEDQGWRIEIKKYPKLTQVGGCRNGTIIGHHPGTWQR
jgi:hexosaminidase